MQTFIEDIKKNLNYDSDFVARNYCFNGKEIGIFYLKSTNDVKNIFLGIISPISKFEGEITIDALLGNIILFPDVKKIKKEEILNEILRNKAIVYVKNSNFAICVDCEKIPSRSPTEPPTSANIYGPREGLTENISQNISLLRKRFPSKNLVLKTNYVGKETQTKVVLMYLNNIACKSVVNKIEKKIKQINIDGIVDSYYIASFLSEHPKSLFSQVGITEKPDVVASKILEGRVAILVDGSPIVLTLPFVIVEDFQNSNDYYSNYIYVSFIRIIRLFGVLFAIIMPGAYLSVRLYHYRLLPINLIITIANSTQNLPFTPLVEIVFILLLFHMLYEVSLRLPQYLGLATSIVGALILGDTGVKAGLISPPGVIIVALSIISIYTVPNQADQMNILRTVFLMLGAMFGFLGITAGIMFVVSYLTTISSYSAPYLAPYAPGVKNDLKDAVLKQPITNLTKRPDSFLTKNKRRLK